MSIFVKLTFTVYISACYGECQYDRRTTSCPGRGRTQGQLKVRSSLFHPLVRLNVYKSALHGSFSTEQHSDDLMGACFFYLI